MGTESLIVIEAAAHLKTARLALYNLAQEGKLPSYKARPKWRFSTLDQSIVQKAIPYAGTRANLVKQATWQAFWHKDISTMMVNTHALNGYPVGVGSPIDGLWEKGSYAEQQKTLV